MTRFRLQQLKPGMVVGSDARTLSGELVIPRGTPLSPQHIQALKAWGIPEIDIHDEPSPLASRGEFSNVDPEHLSRTEDKIYRLFIKCDFQHPAIQELKQLAIKHELEG